MRARVKKRQLVRRIEIIVIVCVVAVSIGVGFYFALMNGDPRAVVDGQPVSQSNLDALYQASISSYGSPGSNYLTDVKALGTAWVTNGKPIFVYVGAEFCPYCAVQRWSMVVALNRFGNFTGLEYMTSAQDDGDFSTLTFVNSTYTSPYVNFQPFETYDRAGNALVTLPSNYSTAFESQGSGDFPFLNFNNQYYISGAILDPTVLGNLNQTQIIGSIGNATSNTLGVQIKEAANVITAVICQTDGNSPPSVCNNPSITALTSTSPLAYVTSPPATNSASLALAYPSGAGEAESFRRD